MGCCLKIMLGGSLCMKNCSYCGRDNLDDALNCRECGTEFEEVSEPIPPEKLEPIKTASSNRERGAQVESKQILKYDNILASSRGMAETHATKVVIFVPANEVVRVTLKYGRSDHRPIMTLSIGIGLSLVGIFGLIEMAEAPSGIRYELGMVAFGIVGGSMIFDTLKQRFFSRCKRNKMCPGWFSQKMRKKGSSGFLPTIKVDL
jgi:hypothetical protein